MVPSVITMQFVRAAPSSSHSACAFEFQCEWFAKYTASSASILSEFIYFLHSIFTNISFHLWAAQSSLSISPDLRSDSRARPLMKLSFLCSFYFVTSCVFVLFCGWYCICLIPVYALSSLSIPLFTSRGSMYLLPKCGCKKENAGQATVCAFVFV